MGSANLGGDASTRTALVGALMGAIHGNVCSVCFTDHTALTSTSVSVAFVFQATPNKRARKDELICAPPRLHRNPPGLSRRPERPRSIRRGVRAACAASDAEEIVIIN